eukprot:3498133-Pleurochrysis_carterae.AAC.4
MLVSGCPYTAMLVNTITTLMKRKPLRAPSISAHRVRSTGAAHRLLRPFALQRCSHRFHLRCPRRAHPEGEDSAARAIEGQLVAVSDECHVLSAQTRARRCSRRARRTRRRCRRARRRVDAPLPTPSPLRSK